MRSSLARVTASAAIAAAALLTASCAGTPEAAPPVTTAPPAAPTTGATDPATPAPDVTDEAPEPVTATCETLVSTDTLAELEAQSWTYKEEPFVIGDVAPADGISCTWGDFSVATGNVLIFAWAPLTADEVTTAQAQLDEDGWMREDSDAGVYYTEDPMQALNTDENGYGMTYRFGDDWVTLSDTKQGLLLIERPAA
ncbi:nitrate ABC transporter substrate-binding protein [Microbacterium invictum]|uniref:Nitrate ABC transporter substrate-binding protein n=1 Tax=Microbacterium invictum TaxID=515415 RepID=A0AA40SMF2_9MICO|nr:MULTISPECIES: nitrate ABC transporter substrate-binding protein [Microbacterium]MBB4138837.1 hypothetical protein [Microbacterium invictum]